MAIQYAPSHGTLNRFTATWVETVDYVHDLGVAAGWTVTALPDGTSYQLSSNNTDGQTITIAGKVYTFRTVINNANNGEVLIGATAPDTLVNLKDAINLGSGSGTRYSSATTINATCSAPRIVEDNLWIWDKLTTAHTGIVPISEVSNGAFSSTFGFLTGAGWELKSVKTAQGLQHCLSVHNTDYTAGFGFPSVPFNTYNVEFTSYKDARYPPQNPTFGNALSLRADGVSFNGIYSPYQIIIYTTIPANLTFLVSGTCWIPDYQLGRTISAATNATPIQITTTSAHGYANGDNVYITLAAGNSGANGNWLIQNVTTNTFELVGSVGTGVYTSGGLSARINDEVAEAFHICGGNNGSSFINEQFSSNGILVAPWTSVNGTMIDSGTCASNLTGFQFLTAGASDNTTTNLQIQWYNQSYIIGETVVRYPLSTGAEPPSIGQWYSSFIVSNPAASGASFTLDGHLFVNLTHNNSTYSLWVAAS